MGAGNSVQLNQQVVNNTLAQIMTNTLQTASASADLSQDIFVECNTITEILAKSYAECTTKFFSDPRILDICSAVSPGAISCGLSNVNWVQSVAITQDVKMLETFDAEINNKLRSNLETNLASNTGILQFGNKTKADIKALIDAVSVIDVKQIQEAFAKSDLKQSLTVNGAKVENLSLNQSTTIISKILQENKTISKIVQDIAVDITGQVNDQNIKNILLWTGVTIGIILVIIGLGYLIDYLVNRKNKKANKNPPGFNILITPKS